MGTSFNRGRSVPIGPERALGYGEGHSPRSSSFRSPRGLGVKESKRSYPALLTRSTRSLMMQCPPPPPTAPCLVDCLDPLSKVLFQSPLLPGAPWLSWYSAGRPLCLVLHCSGHQAGLLSGLLSCPIFPPHTGNVSNSPESLPESHVREAGKTAGQEEPSSSESG